MTFSSTFSTTPQSKKTISALWRLEKIILDTLDFNQVVQKVVDSVLTELGYLKLGYRIIVFALIDKEQSELKRISISQTEEARKALEITPVPFHEINIPFSAKNNLCIRAILEKRPFVTSYWPDILMPSYTSEEAIAVQKAIGIKTSMIYPVIVRDKPIGVLILSMAKKENEVSEEEKDLIRGFTDVVGLALQNAKLYTSLEETSEKLRVANEKLKELDKLKDEFVSLASHELRTPMAAIKSYLWMALNKSQQDLSDNMKKYLNRSYISVDRLINLVNDMLNVSRIESGRISLNLSKVNLVNLASDVKEEVGAKAKERNVKVEVEDTSIPCCLCDQDKIHEVFLNLVGNSLKFTPKDGQVKISFKEEKPYIKVSVADTGRGIAKEDLPKLFTKFGRLSNSYLLVPESSGTGLGLYISKSIVNFHKGSIEAKSDGLDKGSVFTFSLPILGTPLALQLEEEVKKQSPKEAKEIIKTNVNV